MLQDHVNITVKRGVKILTCDPSKRLIEAETRNGEVITINAYNYTPIFRWPLAGERWMVREENGSWYLDGIYETMGPGEAEIKVEPGDVVLSAASGRVLINEQGQLRELLPKIFGHLLPKSTGDLHISATLEPRLSS